jgi:hypothetical protein
MAIAAGPPPWSSGYRRTNRRNLNQQNVEWSLAGGYRNRPDDWEKNPRQEKMRDVRLFNGKMVKVPDDDFQDFIGHQASPPSDPYSQIGQYIDKAFENPDRVRDVDGVGHITYIEYVPTYQVLRVEFATDGAVVVYFRVPKEVFGELAHLAKTGQTAVSPVDGKVRHVLGMRFWDIIRIRGQRSGSRYKFEYAIEGEYVPRGRASDRALKDVASTLDVGTAETSEEEMKDTLRTFTRRLTPDARRVFDNLTTAREMYSFLRSKGVDLPSYEELADPDF